MGALLHDRRAFTVIFADDHQRMMNRYEVAFAGDPKVLEPVIKVAVSRDDVQVQMSVRRPF